MTEPYLIAHLVRGEPAFDIAIRLEDAPDDGEDWWIIPTSGHRDYPYWSASLEIVALYTGQDYDYGAEYKPLEMPEAPAGWRDHYEVSAAPRGQGILAGGRALLERLSLVKPMIRRKVD